MLKPKDLNSSPPGDWKVVAPETGVAFKHFSFSALLKQIRSCREGMGLSTGGDWIERVQEAVCQQNPDVPCFDEDRPERVWLGEDVWRFLTTLKEAVMGGMEPVSTEEQTRRIDICAVCPKKVVIGCRWCGALGGMITELLAGRKAPNIEAVYKQSCGACGCDIASKTVYPLDILKRVDEKLDNKPDYAPGCWMLEPVINC